MIVYLMNMNTYYQKWRVGVVSEDLNMPHYFKEFKSALQKETESVTMPQVQ